MRYCFFKVLLWLCISLPLVVFANPNFDLASTQNNSETARGDLSAVPAISEDSHYLLQKPRQVNSILQEKQKWIEIDDFKGVAEVDYTLAFRRALLHAVSVTGTDGALTIHIPSGNYTITDDNWLGNIDFTKLAPHVNGRFYLTLAGDGWNTKINWKPSGAVGDYYIYKNNSAHTNNMLGWELRNMTINFDSSLLPAGSTINGFYEDGAVPYPTQELRAYFVRFYDVNSGWLGTKAESIAKSGTLLTFRGSANADRTYFDGCSVQGFRTVLDIKNNNESVVHTFVGCNFDVIRGDVFKVSAGSSINVIGGSMTMMSETQSYLFALRLPPTPIVVGTVNFIGIRLELQQSTTGKDLSGIFLYEGGANKSTSNQLSMKVNFIGCNFYPMMGAARSTIKMDAAGGVVLNFDKCDFNNFITNLHKIYIFTSTKYSNYGGNGPFSAINFSDGSAIPSDNVVFENSRAVARVSSQNCNGTLDYDISAVGSGILRGSVGLRLKTASGFWLYAPDSGNKEVGGIIALPLGAVIKSIRFRKSAGGSVALKYRMRAVNGDGTVVYAQSEVAPENLNHEAFVDQLHVITNSAVNRVVKLQADPFFVGGKNKQIMTSDDYFLVDYY